MDINDFEIKIKKCDREKNKFILNLIYKNTIEIRGWTARFLETKSEPKHSFWKILPPCVKKGKNNFFLVCQIQDKDLLIKLEEKIIEVVNSYPDDL
jgi:hypothetical protein